jgi:hypothetical protein
VSVDVTACTDVSTLDNPNASEQAKDHAAEILVEHGVKI